MMIALDPLISSLARTMCTCRYRILATETVTQLLDRWTSMHFDHYTPYAFITIILYMSAVLDPWDSLPVLT
jgi:hypothetical protein